MTLTSDLIPGGTRRRIAAMPLTALTVLTVLAVLVLAFSLLTAPAGAQTAGEGDRLRRLEAEVEGLKAEIAALRAQAPAAATAPAATHEPEPGAAPPPAATPPAATLDELSRRIDLLAAELERLQLGETAAEADVAERGLGPAASKIYRTGRGLSVGGYGEMLYQNFDSTRDDGTPSGSTDELDLLRGVLYFGYKFNDRFLFNSELEWEHASTGEGGEAAVEFAYVDFLWKPAVNLRAGLLLVPMGFVNELHEPTVFLGARRPDVERLILPTTWRENGFGLYGDAGPVSWRTYLVNGFDAAGFSAAGLRGGKQDGARAAAEDFAWVGRLDWAARPGLLVGGSLYAGKAGQGIEAPGGRRLGVGTSIVEGHLQWRRRGFELRALAARAEVDQAAALNRALGLSGAAGVGKALTGGYLEVAYDLFARRGTGQRSLRPYLRLERFDTQAEVPAGYIRDPARDVDSVTLGLAYQPIDPLILKIDYLDYDNGAGTGVDQFNVALGYVF